MLVYCTSLLYHYTFLIDTILSYRCGFPVHSAGRTLLFLVGALVDLTWTWQHFWVLKLKLKTSEPTARKRRWRPRIPLNSQSQSSLPQPGPTWQRLIAVSIGVPAANTACSAAGGADVPDEGLDLILFHKRQRLDVLHVRFCKKKTDVLSRNV